MPRDVTKGASSVSVTLQSPPVVLPGGAGAMLLGRRRYRWETLVVLREPSLTSAAGGVTCNIILTC